VLPSTDNEKRGYIMSDKHIEIFEALVDYMYNQVDVQQSLDSIVQLNIAKELGVPVEWVKIVSDEMYEEVEWA
tara:strand:+ start:1656 stop:1874 length:219 start_codon:yes stop_codon:yes gene_type:complete